MHKLHQSKALFLCCSEGKEVGSFDWLVILIPLHLSLPLPIGLCCVISLTFKKHYINFSTIQKKNGYEVMSKN